MFSHYFTKWVKALNMCPSGVTSTLFKVHTCIHRVIIESDNNSPEYPVIAILTAVLREDGSSTSDHH